MMRDVDRETGVVFWMERLERRMRPVVDAFGNQGISDRWDGLRAILASKLSAFQIAFPYKVGDIFEYLMAFVPYWIERHLGMPASDEGILRWFDTIASSWDDDSMKRFTSKETGELTETIVKFFPPAGQPATRPIQAKPQRSHQSKGRRA